MTGENVHVEVGGNTHLKGALLAAGEVNEEGIFIDNETLAFKTETLTFGNSTNSSYSSSNSFNAGTNIGFGSTEDPQPDTNESSPKVNSSSLSLGNTMGYSGSKVLATLGKGDVQIGDLENSDDLDRLNRDTEAMNKNLYSGSVSTSVDATLDHRFFSEEGREEIVTDYKEMPQNMKTIAYTLPDQYSDNLIEAGVGYIWNALGKYSVILPAHDSGGGILAQIPGLTGLMPPKYRYILAKQNSTLFNPEEFIKLDELSYFKGIPENLQKELKDYYISKNSVVITEENATFQRQTNGMKILWGRPLSMLIHKQANPQNSRSTTIQPTEFWPIFLNVALINLEERPAWQSKQAYSMRK